MKRKLSKPHYSMEKDFFIAERNRKIAGLVDITPELRIERIVIDWFVHPDFPRRNLGKELMKYAFRRGRELGTKWAHVCVPEEEKFSRDFLKEMGFRQVRCFVDLESKIEKGWKRKNFPDLPDWGHFRAGEEALLANIQNRIFTGSWGFCPNSPEEVKYYLRLTKSKWSDILCLKDDSRISGYFWPHPILKRAHRIPPDRWRIHMLGIDPDYQGKGWGKKLFAAGLYSLKAKGAVWVELTVDSENSPAISLYRPFGFRQKARQFWLEKSL